MRALGTGQWGHPQDYRQPALQKPVLRPRRCSVPRRWSGFRRGEGGENPLKMTARPPAIFQMFKSVCACRGWQGSPRTLQQCPCPETMAALLLGEAWPCRTQQPGRIQPDDAWTAQVYQAAHGGRARKEPHLSQAERLVAPTCWAPPAS